MTDNEWLEKVTTVRPLGARLAPTSVFIEGDNPTQRGPQRLMLGVAESIRKHGISTALEVVVVMIGGQRFLRISNGHGRFRIAKQFGIERLPYAIVNLNEEDMASLKAKMRDTMRRLQVRGNTQLDPYKQGSVIEMAEATPSVMDEAPEARRNAYRQALRLFGASELSSLEKDKKFSQHGINVSLRVQGLCKLKRPQAREVYLHLVATNNVNHVYQMMSGAAGSADVISRRVHCVVSDILSRQKKVRYLKYPKQKKKAKLPPVKSA